MLYAASLSIVTQIDYAFEAAAYLPPLRLICEINENAINISRRRARLMPMMMTMMISRVDFWLG